VLIIACGVLVGLFLYSLIVRWHESIERQRQDEANRSKEEKANAFKRGEAQGHADLARLEGQALERNSFWALILIKAKWQEPTTRKLKYRIESQAEYQERLQKLGKAKMTEEELEALEYEERKQRLRIGDRHWNSSDDEWLREVRDRIRELRNE
jgi:hypothetical protein